MPIMLNFVERLVMLTLNQAPAPTLDMYCVIANRAISTALKLGVFEALQEEPLTASEVARRIKANERGMTLLMEALEPIGYLEKVGDRYANTPLVEKWMLLDSPTTIAHLFQFFDTVIERSSYLDETIREGTPPQFLDGSGSISILVAGMHTTLACWTALGSLRMRWSRRLA